MAGISLADLVARFETLEPLRPPPPDYLTSLVVKPRQPNETSEAFREYGRWCTENGGQLDQEVTAAECSIYVMPVAGCFGEAQYWYAVSHGYIGSASLACVTADKTMTSALLSVAVPVPDGSGATESQLAFYSGPELVAFVTKYNDMSKANSAANAAQKERELQDAQAAFERAVAELDRAKDRQPTDVPTVRDSVDFIREKLTISYGRTKLSAFGSGPCDFIARTNDHDAHIDLRALDLNALETVTENKASKYRGGATSPEEVISVYQLLLRDGEDTGHADFKDVDTAKRTAKAFVALGKRCGAKVDTRFK